MKPPKPTWKSRALAAEKERDQKIHELEECDHYAKKQYKAYDAELATTKKDVVKLQSLLSEKQHELDYRPTIEKIVEKEVFKLNWLFWVFFFIWFGEILWMENQVKNLQQPILSPYAVYVTKLQRVDTAKLEICQDSWREDEAELKLLRRKLKDRQEGTTFVE